MSKIVETNNVTFIGWERTPERKLEIYNKKLGEKIVNMHGYENPPQPEKKVEVIKEDKKPNKSKSDRKSRCVQKPNKPLSEIVPDVFDYMLRGFRTKENILKHWIDYKRYDLEINPFLTKPENDVLKFILRMTLLQKRGFQFIKPVDFLEGWKKGHTYKVEPSGVPESTLYNVLNKLKKLEIIYVIKLKHYETLYILNTPKGRDIYNKLQSGYYTYDDIKEFENDLISPKKNITYFDLFNEKDVQYAKIFRAIFLLLLEISEKNISNSTPISGVTPPDIGAITLVNGATPPYIRVPDIAKNIDNIDSCELSTNTYYSDLDSKINKTTTNTQNKLSDLKEVSGNNKNVDDVDLKNSFIKSKEIVSKESGNNISPKPEKTESPGKNQKAAQKSSGAGGPAPDQPEVCGQAVDNSKPDVDKEQEIIYALVAQGIGKTLAKDYLIKNGIENTLACIKYVNEKASRGEIKENKSGYLNSCLKNEFTLPTQEKIQSKIDANLEKFKEFKDIFELLKVKSYDWYSSVTNFENIWLRKFKRYQVDAEQRAWDEIKAHNEFIEMISNDKRAVEKNAKRLGILNAEEEEWLDIIKEQEQSEQDAFYESLMIIIENVPLEKIKIILADVERKVYSEQLINDFIKAITK